MRAARQRASTATWSGGSGFRDTVPDTALAMEILRQHGVWAPPVEVPMQVGPYRLQGILGEGGMARVYAAEHEVLGKRVAIKTLLPELVDHPVVNEMFLREARIASCIRHRNLIDIYDFVTDERGRPYCIMELAAGETLARRLERGPMRVIRALDVAIALADAASAIHAAGYLHRDIKAENVLLMPDHGRLVPKLFDFGIARPLHRDDDEDEIGMCGTPSVMAPEQACQDEVDERTDIWALGVLLFEMTTGDLPFPPHATIREDLVCIVTEAPLPVPEELGPELRALIEACLAKDPGDRPASAAVLVDALRSVRIKLTP